MNEAASDLDHCVTLDGYSLTRAQVVEIARRGATIDFDDDALKRVDTAAAYVAEKARSGEVVYGVTTGFGKNSDVILPSAEAAVELQRNLIISHAVCVGDPIPNEAVRAILAIRINTLLQGHSGIRRETLATLADMLNRGVHPIVPEKGSCGASGDLAPLSHIGLVLIGLGEAEFDGEIMNGADAMQRAGITPVELTYKEGLALNNTTAFMTGLGVLALDRLETLAKTADIAAAMALEAIAGRSAAFDARVHALRPHPGQIAVAENIRKLTVGSTLVDIDPDAVPKVGGDWPIEPGQTTPSAGKSKSPQDSYSIRCVPQVHGAIRDTLSHAISVFDRELSSVTDNPILFPDDDAAISAGNFHGMPLAMALASVKNAIAILASISERRLAKLVDAHTSDGLPFFLVDNNDGIQSGFMIVQYSAAAVVNDLVSRAHPASTYSIPTCANFEDHVSMGANEANHVSAMTDDLERVLAMEILGSAQAIDLRQRILAGELWSDGPTNPEALARAEANRQSAPQASPAISKVVARVRDSVDYLRRDRELRHDIHATIELVRGGKLVAVAERHCGPLS